MTDEECEYGNWGHTRVYHRRKIGSLNHKSALKVRYNEQLNIVEIFEFVHVKDYVKDMIVYNINKTN